MNFTLAEAAAKWCPEVRLVVIDGDVLNNRKKSHDPSMAGTACIGEKCMAWQWADSGNRMRRLCSDPNATTEPERPASVPASWTFYPCEDDEACWVEPEEEAMQRRKGYCGKVAVTPWP